MKSAPAPTPAPAPAATPTVTSPCISVCRMDEASGWCEGCLRTLDEIAVWSLLDEEERQSVCQQLGQRRLAWRQTQAAASNDAGTSA